MAFYRMMDIKQPMMNSCVILTLLLLSIVTYGQKTSATLLVSFPENYKDDSLSVTVKNLYEPGVNISTLQHSSLKQKIRNGKALLSFPLMQQSLLLTRIPKLNYLLFEPGDSIVIGIENEKKTFSGKGSKKNALLALLKDPRYTIPWKDMALRTSNVPLELFLNNYNALKACIPKRLSVLETSKNELSSFAYTFIKSAYIAEAENKMVNDFYDLCKHHAKWGITKADLKQIWDSTLNRSVFFKLGLQHSDTACLVSDLDGFFMNMTYFSKQASMNFENIDSAWSGNPKNAMQHIYENYLDIRNSYSGLAREITLARCIEGTIKQLGFSKELNEMLKDYLSTPGYPKYKDWIRSVVARKESSTEGKMAADFSVTGTDGKTVSLFALKGKMVFVDLWFTGCVGCVEMAGVMKRVEKEFHGNKNIVFLSISTDTEKQKWLNSIAIGKYTSGTGLNAYTGGKGTAHPLIEGYNVTAYPTTFLIDRNGSFLKIQDPRADNGRNLIALLKLELAKLEDGPYVLYGKATKKVHYIVSNPNGPAIVKTTDLPLDAVTDVIDKRFDVSLKKQIVPEPCKFKAAPRLLVLSDIEGNFDALRSLLQANGVIDAAFNWTFGDGHLVCNGDFFDRGKQVTECLWLVYMLEEKAKAKGGYVHFILGNHEVMNMNGALTYVNPKYIHNAQLMGLNYMDLYNRNSELGLWLRSKNVIEKIGDLLFVHGGISKFVNDSGLTISEINNLLRPIYDAEQEVRTTGENTDKAMLFRSKTSPFWYRGYYEPEQQGYENLKGKKLLASMGQIDSTLRKFDVKRIITGHTIVADTISIHYGGKIINTDTKHAKGKSEALLIEGSSFYRVNTEGKRVLLFRDEEK